MEIKSVEDLFKVIDDKRKERDMSERELSRLAGRSPSLFWWWKKHANTTSFATALHYIKILGLKMRIS